MSARWGNLVPTLFLFFTQLKKCYLVDQSKQDISKTILRQLNDVIGEFDLEKCLKMKEFRVIFQ